MDSTSIISIENLKFAYQKDQVILDNLNLEVPAGSIYGFLGANGAGKSTTIRNILGLLKPNKGNIKIFNNELKKSKPKIFKDIGSLIESPSLYPQLHAIDNLKIISKYRNVPKNKIDEVLEKVNLLENSKKKVKHYSTGMKQRLGLAIALIHDPKLLILDEPTSGLDPNGITEIRNIILRLRQEGKTIMLSSHLLSEIEKIASHVGILKNGKMVFEGTLQDLKVLKSSQESLVIKTNDIERSKLVVDQYTVISITDEFIEIDLNEENDIPKIVKKLVDNGLDIYEISRSKSDLEKMFISITTE